MALPESSDTSVYRYYDEHDVLIYVGITGRGMQRNTEHNKTKPWWPYVIRQEVEHYPTRTAAGHREVYLIQTEQPPFNTQHHPDPLHARHTYEVMRAKLGEWQSADPADLARSLGRSLPLTCLGWQHEQATFMTAAEHVPVTRLVHLEGMTRVIRGGTVVGHVDRLARQGPFVAITATVRQGLDLGNAVADVKMLTTKSGVLFPLRRIRLSDDRIP